MDQCTTCGRELHPERAKKYNYRMPRECQEKNAKGLTMAAAGVNKAAEQYLIPDDKTAGSTPRPRRRPELLITSGHWLKSQPCSIQTTVQTDPLPNTG